MMHQRVDILGERRRSPRGELLGDRYIEAPTRIEENLTALQPPGGIEKRAAPNADLSLGVAARKDDSSGG